MKPPSLILCTRTLYIRCQVKVILMARYPHGERYTRLAVVPYPLSHQRNASMPCIVREIVSEGLHQVHHVSISGACHIVVHPTLCMSPYLRHTPFPVAHCTSQLFSEVSPMYSQIPFQSFHQLYPLVKPGAKVLIKIQLTKHYL